MNHLINAPRRKAGFVAACAAAVLASACTTVPGETEAVASTATAFDYEGWDQYLGGSDSSQYSSLAQIDKSNVANLEVAWTYDVGAGAAPQFNPIKVGDTLFLTKGGNTLVALDAATGAEKWTKTYEGRVGARGMNYWQSADGSDRRFLFLMDGMLTAVNATNGEPIAGFGTNGKVDLRVGLPVDIQGMRALMTNNPGRIYKDTIIISLPAEAYDFKSAPANIHAYDVRTGAQKWTFNMVPQRGEFGYDTWPGGEDHGKFGGVHNWSESTVDEKLGLVFIPTGTARYDFYGGNRPGDNLYGNSVVALNAETGERVWHFQTIHHDLWDLDLPQAPKMMTIRKDGEDVPVLIQAVKHGYVFVFDRRTGEPIWPIEERPVPASDVPGEQASPTQPFPTWPKPYARMTFTEDMINPHIPEEDKAKLRELFKTARNEGEFTPPSLQGSIGMPGHNGGANWGSSAVDPVKKRFYINSKHIPVLNKLTLDERPEALAAMPNGGGDVMPYKENVDFMLQSNGLPAINPPWSTLTGYNMETGEIIWQVPNGEVMMLAQQGIRDTGSTAPRGGPVATAGGLIFIGTSSDRKVRARDADTGRVLWEYQLDAASEGVPAVYEQDGKQYVVFPVGGDGLFAPRLGQPKPGANRYVAFALPGQ
ncbi:MAG: pyrroloquinoline quinone-dependent dehydrogenase [Croceibacterium sp.]